MQKPAPSSARIAGVSCQGAGSACACVPRLGSDQATASATSANATNGQGSARTGTMSSHAPPASTAATKPTEPHNRIGP